MKIPAKPPVFSELLIKIFESDRKKGTDLLLQKSKAVDKKGRYVASLIMLWVYNILLFKYQKYIFFEFISYTSYIL